MLLPLLALLQLQLAAGAIVAPNPTMRWYLGANCVGNPGATVTLLPGCGDYMIFGTLITLMATRNVNASTWSITTYVDLGCGGSIGVLFVNIPYPGSDKVCTADTTGDRYGPGGRCLLAGARMCWPASPLPPCPFHTRTHTRTPGTHPQQLSL